MSEFGNVLVQEMARQNETAVEMASRMGVGDSHISAFTKDRRKSCNVETLMKMVKGISDDEEVQARLLEAYFRDQCLPKYKAWVRVDPQAQWSSIIREEVEGAALDPVSELSAILRKLSLPEKVILALGYIARFTLGRHKFRVVIEDLGKFAREELERGEAGK